MFARSLIRSLALALAVSLVPAAALADDGAQGRQGAGQAEGRKGEGARHGREGREAKFPMEAKKFREKLDGRITKIRGRIEKQLENKKVPEAVRKQVLAEVDQGAAKVRAAADKAAADGSVSKEEAQSVRQVAKEVRNDLRAKAKARGVDLPEGKGRGHGKGGKGGKGKAGKAA